MNKNSKIYIAGHKGLVGSAIVRRLIDEGYENIITKSRDELDLLNKEKVSQFFKKETPEYIFLAAAKVGGILGNSKYPADFIYQNLEIQNNILHNAHINNVKKLIFLGSSCIYPKMSQQPIKEEYLLTGSLEETNKPYAIAKIAGIIACESYNRQHGTRFIPVMPTNLYGPNDNFDLETSHVLPALLRKFHEAKINSQDSVSVWGTGSASREFLHVDDLADALVFLMKNHYDNEMVNIGTGQDLSIKQVAELIGNIVGFKGNIKWDTSKPDGTPRKLLDVDKLRSLGWRHQIELEQGLKDYYRWFLENIDSIKK